MSTLVHKYVDDCRTGINPKMICRVRSGWLVLGDVQVLRGYSLLLPDPVVPDLNALNPEERSLYLSEMALIGAALQDTTGAYRINYEILGNSEPALHVHIFPRYSDEPDGLRSGPVWFYDWDAAPRFEDTRDRPLIDELRTRIETKGIVI
jgi:diadenosine tetraphosphate (Ap4A) HIT family hydrolase